MYGPSSHDKKESRRPSRTPRMSRRRLRVAVVAAASIVAWALGVSTAPLANAATVNVTCVGTQHVNHTPGLLLFTPRVTTLTVNEILAPCVSSSYPGITGRHQRSFQTRPITCLSLLSPNSFSKVLTWSNGATSTFDFNQVATTVGGNSVVTLSGVISDGLFKGSSAVETITGPANTLECLFEPGLRDRFNVVTLVITSG